MALLGTNNIIQTQVMQTNVLRTFSNGNQGWAEPSSDYRISITPRLSNSMILLQYFIPFNQYTGGANNIFGFKAIRISPNGGDVSGVGQDAGSRRPMAGGNARSQNGYDINDHNMESFTTYDFPGTTSTCTYGFQMYREDSDAGTIYIAHSNSDNSSWGMTSRVVIVAMEIKQ